VKVTVRNGNVDKALRLFRKKIAEENVLFDYKENQHYEKRSAKKQSKLASAKARERKRQETNTPRKLF
jgi:small subunit ribosomal protein S21